MKRTHDSRVETDPAATQKTAVTGDSDTKETSGNKPASTAPKSWRQYIEQSLPAQEQENPAETAPQKAGHSGKKEAKAAAAAKP